MKSIAAERVRNNNAYLLFYERVGKPESKSEKPLLESPPGAATGVLQGLDPSLVTSSLSVRRIESSPEKKLQEGGDEVVVVDEGEDNYDTYEEEEEHGEEGDDDVLDEPNGLTTSGSKKFRTAGKTASLMAFFDASLGHSLSRRGKHRKGMEQPLPANVRRAIWEENMTFFRDKHLFDPGM